jgi:endoglucanase
MSDPFWILSEHETYEAPGLAALIFHNRYPEGKQGGVELIHHGERTLTCGDVRLSTAPGQWDGLPEIGERVVEHDGAAVAVSCRFVEEDFSYTVRVAPDGAALRISVDLARPLPEVLEGRAGFNLEIYPAAYFGRTFELGGAALINSTQRVFPEHAGALRLVAEDGAIVCPPLASGTRLVAAPDDPLRRFEVVSETGNLGLFDGRHAAQNGWFVLRELIQPDATTDAIVWRLTPHAVPDWRRAPVICVSQVGYHPAQVKQAVLELDPRDGVSGEAVLERISSDGPETVLSAQPEFWGRWLRWTYAVFDFSEIREPGLYRVRYGAEVTPAFEIHPEVYQHEVWQPVLETFFPVQMCHVAVKDRYHTWHGACHLDDALQAPPDHTHFDGYRQYGETETPYAPGEHVPGLDRGGWHDAGDFDLAAGSQARTTHTLALVSELLGLRSDQTTVLPEARLVLLHTPDGKPDIVEQVAHGVEALLGGYRAVGHSFHGIIAGTIAQYVHLGDAATMTDNVVGAPGGTPGKADDRWVFTNHDTALDYMVAGALAASSRVLRESYPALADESLQWAEAVWHYEHDHEPVAQPGAYVPRGPEMQEIRAAVELLLATGDPRYRERLLELRPLIEERVMWVGGAVARALPAIGDEAFAAGVREAVTKAMAEFEKELATNPFGILFHPHIWGIGWQLLGYATQLVQLRLAFPDLIDPEIVLRVLNYTHGCHPASNTSLVSGVGAKSATVAYGVNRVDWSYTPGGVISGPALIRPDFMELKEPWPYLWQQTEYVIGGAADYLFCVLAADQILNE